MNIEQYDKFLEIEKILHETLEIKADGDISLVWNIPEAAEKISTRYF